MKKITLILSGIILLSSGFLIFDNKKESFYEKSKIYNTFLETEEYKNIISALESEPASDIEKLKLIEFLNVFEGSTIEELSTIFEVEMSKDGSCWWVTTSTHCQHCRHSLFKCGITTAYRPCTKFQLEYCSGGYWSGAHRVQSYTVCC